MNAFAALLFSGLIVALVDQASKSLVTARLQIGHFHSLLGPVGFRRIESARAGYTRLSNGYLLVAAVCLLVFVFSLLSILPSLPTWGAIGLGMLVGAASSNLLDRFLRGAVVDFIAVRGWRIFNLADAAMFAGVLLTWSAL